jgi:hypothetical protein
MSSLVAIIMHCVKQILELKYTHDKRKTIENRLCHVHVQIRRVQNEPFQNVSIAKATSEIFRKVIIPRSYVRFS